ncbi:MAG: sigma-70 region 4 domain-containing protein [Clostridia bacterium]|nr:sigma-70 region 4 domain-containing protein [Clostridia bacterium]
MELEAVCKVIDARNPLYAKAIIMKEYHGMSVDEIARELHTTKRRVYFYLDEAKKIGKQYKEEYYK